LTAALCQDCPEAGTRRAVATGRSGCKVHDGCIGSRYAAGNHGGRRCEHFGRWRCLRSRCALHGSGRAHCAPSRAVNSRSEAPLSCCWATARRTRRCSFQRA
jgi:hypothetical protein